MEAPYTIVPLPRPLDNARGQIQAAPVYGIRQSKKRKRHEVAVGIDGEAVNVYNVQSQRLVASYALPPQTYLCSPPCSIYLRANAALPPRRRTYFVAKTSPGDRKRRLVCFEERLRNKKESGDEPVQPAKKEYKLDDGEVAGLDVVPSSVDQQPSVLVTYASGDSVSIGGDLSRSEKHNRPSVENTDKYEVEYATVVESDAARKGLLKGREDIVALLDQQSTGSVLQCRIIRANGCRRFALYTLGQVAEDSIQTLKARTALLMSYELPSPRKADLQATQLELHAASGTLYQLVHGRLSIYDLSGTVPNLVTKLGGRSAPVSSFARISAVSVLSVSGDVATVYETKFGSCQGTVNLRRAASGTQARKRKRENDAEELNSFDLISCFADLGLVVALNGSELMALQLDEAVRSSKRARSHGTLLANVMGKGSFKEIVNPDKSEKREKKWKDWTAKVDSLIEADDMEGLENLVANDRKLGVQRSAKKDPDEWDDATELPSNDQVAYDELWPLPEPFDPQDIDRQKILYLLGKTFDYSESQQDGLELAIPSAKLLEFFSLAGFLSVHHVRQALSHNMPPESTQNTLAQSGDIMGAIRHIDDDFHLMHHLFSLPVHWEEEELIQALRILVQSFDTISEAEPQLSLPAPPQPNGDSDMTNGNVDSDLDLESNIAEQELDHAMNALTSGLEVRSNTLRLIFARLSTFDHSLIASSMRTMMSHRELVFFIHILRIELADAGWTSKYVDAVESDGVQEGLVNSLGGVEKGGPSEQAIRVIGDLLNCAVDAIGVSGWLVGLGGSDAHGTRELLNSLRAEISAGLEGCLEAYALGTYLMDVERFAASSEQTQLVSRNHYAEEDGGEVGAEQALLPVGGRAAPAIVNSRDSKSGKKSKMAIGREKSRTVGKYSFERIRI